MIVMNKPCSLFYLSLTETPLICWFKKIPSIEETRILYLFSICFHFWVLFFFVGSWQYRESTEHATKVIPKSQMQVCASMFSSGRWWCSALRGPQETTNRRHIYKSAQRSIYCGQHFFQRGGYYCERVNLPEGQCVKSINSEWNSLQLNAKFRNIGYLFVIIIRWTSWGSFSRTTVTPLQHLNGR